MAVVTGPTPPFTGGDGGAARSHALEVHVADQAAAHEVRADVHHHGPFAHVLCPHQAGAADAHHQDVGPLRLGCQVGSTRMALDHRGVACEEECRDRLPHDVAAAHDHRPLSGDGHLVVVQDGHHRGGGGRNQACAPQQQLAQVRVADALHVLGGRDEVVEAHGIHLGRQGVLHEDAVDLRGPQPGPARAPPSNALRRPPRGRASRTPRPSRGSGASWPRRTSGRRRHPAAAGWPGPASWRREGPPGARAAGRRSAGPPRSRRAGRGCRGCWVRQA